MRKLLEFDFFGTISDIRLLRKSDIPSSTSNELDGKLDRSKAPVHTHEIGYMAGRIASSKACTFDWPKDDGPANDKLQELKTLAKDNKANLILAATITLLERIKADGTIEVSDDAYNCVKDSLPGIEHPNQVADIYAAACNEVCSIIPKPLIDLPEAFDDSEMIDMPPVIITP